MLSIAGVAAQTLLYESANSLGASRFCKSSIKRG